MRDVQGLRYGVCRGWVWGAEPQVLMFGEPGNHVAVKVKLTE